MCLMSLRKRKFSCRFVGKCIPFFDDYLLHYSVFAMIRKVAYEIEGGTHRDA